jgi:hypothetical protein
LAAAILSTEAAALNSKAVNTAQDSTFATELIVLGLAGEVAIAVFLVILIIKALKSDFLKKKTK